MTKTKQIKPHFRIHKRNGYPAYLYAEKDDEYKYIGLTHSPITQRVRNKKLRFNPNEKDNSSSYVRPFSTRDKKIILKIEN